MSNDVFRFAFVTDPQIGMESPAGLRGPGSDKERLDRAIARINEEALDFVVFGGDLINSADDEHTDAQLDVLRESVSALTVPYVGVVGNHDGGDPASSSKYVERGWPVRFSLHHKNTWLVGANSMMLRGDFGDQARQQEWEYLEAELSGAPADCAHRFVVMHWPLLIQHPDEEDNYWNVAARDALIELFRQHDVSCVLTGHWHQDIDARWRGISLVTSIGTSVALQYPEERSFKIITVFQDGWTVQRVSVEGS